jgi:histidinol dehydrogenase
VLIENLKVSKDEIDEAYDTLYDELLTALKNAADNIERFHKRQIPKEWEMEVNPGIVAGQIVRPINSAGCYIPGGRSAYPSSILMTVIPAKIAGVEKVVCVTPPQKDGKILDAILVAADIAGADEIYKVGGAQAIAALAFGTESVPQVEKIVGPGNIFVTAAKKLVYGQVDIEFPAGPSEVLILADETANPTYVAADLLSQAEHDELASAILITTSMELAKKVSEEVDKFVAVLSRKEIIQKSLDNYGYILVADTMDDAIEATNEIASEHLEIVTKNPFETMTKVRHAGAIFIGEYSSEPPGDYFAGPNHVLPTNGTAKFFSPLGVDDFIKKSSIISYSKEALEAVYKDIVTFAECEQLTAHANSIKVRFED